ncbi:ABC transporter ATP-binding protein [Bacillus vallismortis]|uniref:ABC transporter ATP-binding protein n=1 Tax=Bacillus vallismortis TaxID=72361 RepID=A0ABY4XYP7_BACVA|nr:MULTISPECIES: ABC transporter ATP-binding protein [Bacillus]MBL3647508.1 ABC transporter ATP-binding protein [Bacillus sp. RHFS10]USP95379.1 ABC transporter ATP-binding protein [Bacillus vallismortis]
MANMLEVKHLNKTYKGQVSHQALKQISFSVEEGEFTAVMGPSGSGKTTLLNIISTIDRPDSGDVLIKGDNPHNLKRTRLAQFRRKQLGFVFQDFNLLDTLTIGENIMLPLTLEKESPSVMEKKLYAIAEKLGIENLLQKRPFEVSGGQRQRAAIARAVIHKPSLILADEPTGNLDSKASKDVMETMQSLNQNDQITALMVTHDPVAASYCQRVIFIKDGTLFNEIYRGDNRQVFYDQILDVLSMLGGNANDLSSVRL